MTYKSLWVESYRPKTLEEFVFHSQEHEKAFRNIIKTRMLPHLILSGIQGTGKTTLAFILINALEIDPSDVLTINSTKENSVDVMRDKIDNFISTFAMSEYKVVHLQEADYLSHHAQAALRVMLEERADNARFIMTCNYDNKIMPAIKSRCQQFQFKAPDRDYVTEYVANILVKEKIKFDLDLLDKFVTTGYPDVRKIVNLLQQHSIEGVLSPITAAKGNDDYKFKLLDLISGTNEDWTEARKLVCENVSGQEWEDVYRFLYENLANSGKFKNRPKWEEGIVIIADHLHKHALVADPEINAAAMFIRLGAL